MQNTVITSTGLFTPTQSISNKELVHSYNQYVEKFNTQNQSKIDDGIIEPMMSSSVEFIEKASGIKSRYVMAKESILDIKTMAPRLAERDDDELCILAEIAVKAAKDALARADRDPQDVDAVICACSNLQRAYPAIAVEVQDALGIDGFAFDMNVACSSATFGIQAASNMITAGNAQSILVVNPEICSGHLDFTDRDSHFIFGDVATAVLVEAGDRHSGQAFGIIGTKLKTVFSNNIRNNFGFLNRTSPETASAPDKLFKQNGRSVFKEVVPMVAKLIADEVANMGGDTKSLKRLWLHQANQNMNRLIAAKILGSEAEEERSPTILDEYANTSSAGSIIAFHKHSDDFVKGDQGAICSFGAGYSAGLVYIEKL